MQTYRVSVFFKEVAVVAALISVLALSGYAQEPKEKPAKIPPTEKLLDLKQIVTMKGASNNGGTGTNKVDYLNWCGSRRNILEEALIDFETQVKSGNLEEAGDTLYRGLEAAIKFRPSNTSEDFKDESFAARIMFQGLVMAKEIKKKYLCDGSQNDTCKPRENGATIYAEFLKGYYGFIADKKAFDLDELYLLPNAYDWKSEKCRELKDCGNTESAIESMESQHIQIMGEFLKWHESVFFDSERKTDIPRWSSTFYLFLSEFAASFIGVGDNSEINHTEDPARLSCFQRDLTNLVTRLQPINISRTHPRGEIERTVELTTKKLSLIAEQLIKGGCPDYKKARK